MLPFPPVGHRLKTTLQNFYVDVEPVLLLEHDPGRLFALVYPDSENNTAFALARNPSELEGAAVLYSDYSSPYVIYGSEQVWISAPSGSGQHGMILLHQVFAG